MSFEFSDKNIIFVAGIIQNNNKKKTERIMRMSFFLPLLMVIVTLLIVISATAGALPFNEEWSNTIEAIAVTGALLVSGFALWYAKKEYERHKVSEKTTILCQYLQRYDSDPIIRQMTDYILETAKLDENGDIIGFDNSKIPTKIPSVRDKEIFMHFFEQLEMHIENGMLERKEVNDQLCFYAGIFHRFEEFHADITDYDDERYWHYFHSFVNNIPKDFYD